MNQVVTENCVCGIDVFIHKNGEHQAEYEDFTGTIPHTKLRCELNQIVSERTSQLEIELR